MLQLVLDWVLMVEIRGLVFDEFRQFNINVYMYTTIWSCYIIMNVLVLKIVL